MRKKLLWELIELNHIVDRRILKTIKNSTDTSAVFLINRDFTHFVYVLNSFPFVQESLSETWGPLRTSAKMFGEKCF